MPGINVRGDQHLNFTREEAAAWLGDVQVRYRAPTVHHNNPADERLSLAIGVVALFVFLAVIWVAFSGSIQKQMASDAAKSSVQSRTAAREGIQAADSHREETISQQAFPSVAYLPAGWFYGHMVGELPLSNAEGKSIAALPNGTKFFGTAAASAVQLIVAADGSSWGYGELLMPEDLHNAPIAVKPGWEKAATLIGQIEASGIADALRNGPKPEPPKDGYLPAGWTSGCLDQDESLTYGVYGIKFGTVPKGTCLLYEIADVEGWRLLISPDGSYRGYAHLPLLYTVPKRTPMRPEYAGAVALIHRLEDGSAPHEGLDEMREAFVKNAPTPIPDSGEEQ